MLPNYIHHLPGNSPLILAMPHSGLQVPEWMHLLDLERGEVQATLNRAVDLCVPYVTGFHSFEGDRLKPNKLWTDLHRAVIDVNRSRDDVDSLSVASVDQYGLASRHTAGEVLKPHGLIWRTTFSVPGEAGGMLQRPYKVKELDQLLDVAYDPYLAAMSLAIDGMRQEHGRVVYLELHSMPPIHPRKVEEGMHQGAYMIGPEVDRGYLKDGGLPDFLISDRGCAHPDILRLVKDIFEQGRYGFLVDRMDSVAGRAVRSPRESIANPKQHIYSLNIETVGRTFEPHRLDGGMVLNLEGADRAQQAFRELFIALEQWEPREEP